MSQDNLIKLECTEEGCKQTNYYSKKNKRKLQQAGKLKLKKHCKHCRKHTVHKETK